MAEDNNQTNQHLYEIKGQISALIASVEITNRNLQASVERAHNRLTVHDVDINAVRLELIKYKNDIETLNREVEDLENSIEPKSVLKKIGTFCGYVIAGFFAVYEIIKFLHGG